MFRVEPHQLLFIYAGLGLAVIFLAALLHTKRRSGRERAAMREMIKCGLCAFRFRDETRMVHPRCPNCGALVERKRHSAL
jgi:predicted RNA-binding Zn-ribbon protein involved in translation (DUF1610 family)